MKSSPVIMLLLALLLHSCAKKAEQKPETLPVDDKAQQIVDRAIEAHGGDLYKQARISFTFRGKRHVVEQSDKAYRYERSFTEDGDKVKDVYENGVFKRTVNSEEVTLTDRQLDRFIEDVNGVSYFAMLPYKLNDAAVIKEFVGEVTVKGKGYDKIKVTFEELGGGHSPDNVFYFWFDQSTGFMEYLGYNKFGNRFRAPYNIRTVNGIRFADNVNYGGGDFSDDDISTYDQHFEAGELKELSRIILEDVVVELIR
ncbi:MAG: hypothetical protein HEP71_28935 [Roseivirga sp.]|nr:hypothetical protein [Roseivirga sp.]